MKRKFAITIVIISLFLPVIITSCAGPDGSAFQKYWWAGSLRYISDTNPSTPATIHNDIYFLTNAGSYYMEYTSWDYSSWYIYYTIKTNKGTFLQKGDSIWYEIGLYSTGPTLYKWSYARSLNTDSLEEQPNNANIVVTKDATPHNKGPIIGHEERTYDNGTITIEYGRLY